METVKCPVCNGDGYVFYEGTTAAYGDDPSDIVPCPTCHNTKAVSREWAWKYRGDYNYCDGCHEWLPVAEVHNKTQSGVESIDYYCYTCYNKHNSNAVR